MKDMRIGFICNLTWGKDFRTQGNEILINQSKSFDERPLIYNQSIKHQRLRAKGELMVSETKTVHEKEEALKYLEAGKNMGWVLFCFSFKELKVSPFLQLWGWNWKCTCVASPAVPFYSPAECFEGSLVCSRLWSTEFLEQILLLNKTSLWINASYTP